MADSRWAIVSYWQMFVLIVLILINDLVFTTLSTEIKIADPNQIAPEAVQSGPSLFDSKISAFKMLEHPP